MGRRHFSRIWRKALLSSVQRFFSTFPGAWLTWCPSHANVWPELKILSAGEEPHPQFWLQFSTSLHADCCPKTKDPLPNFLWRKGIIFGAKGSGQSFGLFPVMLFHSGYYNDLHSLLCPTNLGLWSADSVVWPYSDCLSGQSSGLVSSNTEG